jgi:hypothetical protein
MTAKPSLVEPNIKPQVYSTKIDVENNLERIAIFLRNGGEWSYDLVLLMDAWLDKALEKGFRLKDRKQKER